MELEFFVVTGTSAYRVSHDGEVKNAPVVEKIDCNGDSAIAIGERLKPAPGEKLLISPDWLCFFEPEPDKPVETLSNAHFGAHSSPIIALFLNRDRALACLEFGDKVPADKRWTRETKEVLDMIPADHPQFEVSRYSIRQRRFFPSAG